MADTAAADGKGLVLVLDGLVIVNRFPGRDHGMGAAMAGGAI